MCSMFLGYKTVEEHSYLIQNIILTKRKNKKKFVNTSFLRYDIIEKQLKCWGQGMQNTTCSPLQNNHRLYLKGTDCYM